jgi:hypothetical protein
MISDMIIVSGESSYAWVMKVGSFWRCFATTLHNTHERDGKVTFNGRYWASENEKFISYPKAIIDDFGTLTPIA